jgi:hypothetical protein
MITSLISSGLMVTSVSLATLPTTEFDLISFVENLFIVIVILSHSIDFLVDLSIKTYEKIANANFLVPKRYATKIGSNPDHVKGDGSQIIEDYQKNESKNEVRLIKIIHIQARLISRLEFELSQYKEDNIERRMDLNQKKRNSQKFNPPI